MRLIVMLVGIAIGFVFIWKTNWFLEQFGRVRWAEEHLSGGTWSFYKLFGLGIILASLLFFSGILQRIILAIFAPGAQSFTPPEE